MLNWRPKWARPGVRSLMAIEARNARGGVGTKLTREGQIVGGFVSLVWLVDSPSAMFGAGREATGSGSE
jgi:hypothetical protein